MIEFLQGIGLMNSAARAVLAGLAMVVLLGLYEGLRAIFNRRK